MPNIPSFVPSPLHPTNHTPLKVNELIDLPTFSWKMEDLQLLFGPQVVTEISKIPIPIVSGSDSWVWIPDDASIFSSKSAYNTILDHIPNHGSLSTPIDWSKLWKLNIHERLKTMLWRFAADVIPTRALLGSRFYIQE